MPGLLSFESQHRILCYLGQLKFLSPPQKSLEDSSYANEVPDPFSKAHLPLSNEEGELIRADGGKKACLDAITLWHHVHMSVRIEAPYEHTSPESSTMYEH